MTDYRMLYEELKKELNDGPYIDPDVHGPEFREEFHNLKRMNGYMKRDNITQVVNIITRGSQIIKTQEEKIKSQEEKIKVLKIKVEEYEEELVIGHPLSEEYFKQLISKQEEHIKMLEKDFKYKEKENIDDLYPITKKDFPEIIHIILKENGGSMNVMQISKEIWDRHQKRLSLSDMFYTWQYDFRWGGTELRKTGIMKTSKDSKKGIWQLV